MSRTRNYIANASGLLSCLVVAAFAASSLVGCNKVPLKNAGDADQSAATTDPQASGSEANPAQNANTSGTAAAAPANTSRQAATPVDPAAQAMAEAGTLSSTQPYPDNMPNMDGAMSEEQAAPQMQINPELLRRPFMTLQPTEATEPAELVQFIGRVDAAISELVQVGIRDMVSEQLYVESGLRLGRMKREAGRRLADAAQATASQRKTGMMAQLVALSHMSGLRDVEAAKELQRFAEQMTASEDPELAQQSRVVLLGFEVQALQNGLHATPQELLSQVDGLFARPEDRSFPEFMALQNAAQVLTQMGFAEESQQVLDRIATEYINSPDPQLRGEAWSLATEGSPMVENFIRAVQPGETPAGDRTASVAARALVDAFPNMTTLEQIASVIGNLEYGGRVEVSRQLAEVVSRGLESIQGSESQAFAIRTVLDAHAARQTLLGQPLNLGDVVAFDDKPFSLDDYQGKIVLVDFWATWCMPCLKEIPNIREVHDRLHEQGFAVVGVNMDEDLAAAKEFVQQRNLPWRTVHAADESKLGFRAAFSGEMGISMIPFMIVLDQTGTVVAIHVRGEELGPKIEELLSQSP